MAGKALFADEGEDAFKRERGGPPGDLDITPMIDVTFLLLIFFMVSSNMQGTPPIDLPPAEHSTGVTVASSIVVTVKAPTGSNDSPQILLGDGKGQEASLSEFKAFLEEQQKMGLNKVVVKAEGDVPHGFVNDVARAVKDIEGLEMFLGVGDSPKK
jgi:biopolymer transport protein ExbD